MRIAYRTLGLAMLVAVAGCNKSESKSQGAPPPPVEPAPQPGACTSGGGKVDDPVTAAFFPREVGGYCVDPNGETRVFADGSKLTLESVCTDAFDGECEVYKGFGLKRVTNLRYIDGSGTPGTIELYLSQFSTQEGAYAMFTKRVVADGDPAETAPRKLEAGAAGAIGTGRAYVWKGAYLAELQYTNEQETPAEMKASSDKVLSPLAKDLGGKLPGEASLPPAAAKLPDEGQVPLGISYATRDSLGVRGAGASAEGFYKEGDKRFRIVSFTRGDADQAKDVLKTFAKLKGATEEKGLGDGAVHVMLGEKDGPKIEWLLARSGSQVLGIGDEVHVLTAEMAPAEQAKLSLSREEKSARLKGLLSR